jgi:hypothetical protein
MQTTECSLRIMVVLKIVIVHNMFYVKNYLPGPGDVEHGEVASSASLTAFGYLRFSKPPVKYTVLIWMQIKLHLCHCDSLIHLPTRLIRRGNA